MYLFTKEKGWEKIPNKFVAEDVEDELFHFGFVNTNVELYKDRSSMLELKLYENTKNIIEEEFVVHLSFFERIYEILIPSLPDLFAFLKEFQTIIGKK